ncbi:gamma carbonic anhydrase family protein [Neisseriaceae bacterium B1]
MNIRPYLDQTPTLADNTFIDPSAVVIGETHLAEKVSIWCGVVIRADVNSIHIGARSNVQDLSMLHVSKKNAAKPQGSPLIIGEDVTIGHQVMLHGCTVGNRVLIGIGCIVLDDAIIEDDVIIGAGSLVPPRKILKSGYLYIGSPAQAVRELTNADRTSILENAQHYQNLAKNHQKSLKHFQAA